MPVPIPTMMSLASVGRPEIGQSTAWKPLHNSFNLAADGTPSAAASATVGMTIVTGRAAEAVFVARFLVNA